MRTSKSIDDAIIINMITPAEIRTRLRDIDRDPECLKDAQGKEEDFMRNWFLMGGQAERKEFSYVWCLLYGWDIQRLSSSPTSLITVPSQANSETVIKKPDLQRISEPDLSQESRNTVQFLSKQEMVVKFHNNIFWINPSFQTSSIQSTDQPLILVVTTASICQILDVIQFSSKNTKLITTQAIYRKMKELSSFMAEYQSFTLPTTYLLKPNEYFEYGKIMWLIRENCWFEYSYDLNISFPHTRQTFLLESPKLDEAKLIYYGWKKNLISQSNYQKYIRQWDRNITKVVKESILIASLPIQKKQKMDWFLNFIEKQLIQTLTNHEQDYLFACCQIMELIPNQIIAKKDYRFDYLYLLLVGQFELRDPKQPANLHKFYGLEELQQNKDTYTFTLASITSATIMRIDKGNVMFHLYDLLH